MQPGVSTSLVIHQVVRDNECYPSKSLSVDYFSVDYIVKLRAGQRGQL